MSAIEMMDPKMDAGMTCNRKSVSPLSFQVSLDFFLTKFFVSQNSSDSWLFKGLSSDLAAKRNNYRYPESELMSSMCRDDRSFCRYNTLTAEVIVYSFRPRSGFDHLFISQEAVSSGHLPLVNPNPAQQIGIIGRNTTTEWSFLC